MLATHDIHAPLELEKTRVDKYLADTLGISRARVQQLIADGQLCDMQGKPITNPAHKIKAGDALRMMVPEVKAMTLTPTPMALDIAYEDASLIVINKPAGLTVHPAPGNYEGTLVHGLLAHCAGELSGIGGVARPGIVHRLDKDTSGLMIVAKTDEAHQHLAAQLKLRTLKRRYTAFTWGAPRMLSGVVDAPIARHPHKRKEMSVQQHGKTARTHFETMARYMQGEALVAAQVMCQLETGRTHQIRVHMAHLGCGIIGDPVYGVNNAQRLSRLKAHVGALPEGVLAALQACKLQALHAAHIGFIHPQTEVLMEFSSPLPEALQTLENALESLTKA
jgi:23S rRNA pseudouridine1911/1915/1917 synthase